MARNTQQKMQLAVAGVISAFGIVNAVKTFYDLLQMPTMEHPALLTVTVLYGAGAFVLYRVTMPRIYGVLIIVAAISTLWLLFRYWEPKPIENFGVLLGAAILFGDGIEKTGVLEPFRPRPVRE